ARRIGAALRALRLARLHRALLLAAAAVRFAAAEIEGRLHREPAQPVTGVGDVRPFRTGDALEDLEEDFLRDVLGVGAVARDAPRTSVHGRVMSAHPRLETGRGSA